MARIKAGLFDSGTTYFHLWYLPMFICLMCFAPFINTCIIGRKQTFKDFIYIFAVFALFFSLNQISIIGWEIFDAEISWFKSFPLYIGYFVIGYFMDEYYQKIPIGNKTNLIILGSLLGLAPLLNFFSARTLEIVKDYFVLNNTGILNFVITVSIFHLFSINREKFREKYLITNLASMSFGIYLIHPVFIAVIRRYLGPLVTESVVGLPLVIVLTLIFSCIAVTILSKIKWFKTLCYRLGN